jgi:hypothetical protein
MKLSKLRTWLCAPSEDFSHEGLDDLMKVWEFMETVQAVIPVHSGSSSSEVSDKD